ncbi:MAG: WD40 repeat domain-containing protein [Thermoflexales bacterium]|nr:WD40 repeat domain-containing protein [Thermoflexales bacterium]
MAYAKGKLVGKLIGPPDKRIEVDFARFAPPAPACGWEYNTAISPGGRWQAVYNCEHFLIFDGKTGQIKEIDLGEKFEEKRWALDAQWSPDGRTLAVRATMGRLPNPFSFLLLVDPWIGEVREVSVLRPSYIHNLAWSPNGRFILLSGTISETNRVSYRLIDLSTGQEHPLYLLPPEVRGGSSFAWSPDGDNLLINCTKPGEGALCIIQVEVQQ